MEMVWAAVSQITYSLRDQINSDDADFLYEDREIERRYRRVYFTSLSLFVSSFCSIYSYFDTGEI